MGNTGGPDRCGPALNAYCQGGRAAALAGERKGGDAGSRTHEPPKGEASREGHRGGTCDREETGCRSETDVEAGRAVS